MLCVYMISIGHKKCVDKCHFMVVESDYFFIHIIILFFE